jgi:hypothetical protein
MPRPLAIAMLALSLSAGFGVTVSVAAPAVSELATDSEEGPLAAGLCQTDSDNHFCPLSFVGRCDRWIVQADSLALHRTNGRNRPLVVASGSGEGVLNTDDLDLGFELGPRLLLDHRTRSDGGWELIYFGLHEWTAAVAVEDINNLDIPGTLVGVAQDFTAADRFAITFSSRLHNAEANLLRDRDTWTVLAGLRYLRLDEELVLSATDSDSGTSDYTVRSSSDLIGGQVGLRTGRLCGRWSWDATLKVAVFGSILAQDQSLLDADNTFVLRDASALCGTASILGDLQIAGSYRLNHVWALRAGYNLMYVNGIALAAEQLNFDNLADSGQHLQRSDWFLHGASLGIEARW